MPGFTTAGATEPALKVVAATAAFLILGPISPAAACSVCIAHAFGAAMHGLGAQTLPKGKTVLGLSYLNFDKSNAGEEAGTTETELFSQTSLDLYHGLTDRMMLRGSLPTVDKTMRVDGAADRHARGMGDAVMGLTFQVPPHMKDRFLTAFTFDVKLPTGANNLKDANGDVKEEHLQLGTGSTDAAAGVSLTWDGADPGKMYFAGLRGRLNGKNGRGFHYGNALFYNAGYVLPLSPIEDKGAVVFEFNGRIAARDKDGTGAYDPDSGGHLGYLSGSYRRSLMPGYGLIVTYQAPVLKQLNGSQREKALFSLSTSHAF